MIYFIQSENGLIKIVNSKNIEIELKKLERSSPIKLNILDSISGDAEIEKDLKSLFASNISHGDWYQPSAIVFDIIKQAKTGIIKSKNICFQFSDWEKQIIHGTLLGNGYLTLTKKSVNPYLTISENRNQQWLLYKGAELESFSAKKPLIETKSVWKWRASCNPGWNDFYNLHYKEKKIIKMTVLDRLKDIGLAIWFGDKGYWYNKEQVGLRTSSYSEVDNNTIKCYFNEVGMECSIVDIALNRKNIIFSASGTSSFLKIIAHQLPAFLQYKLQFNI